MVKKVNCKDGLNYQEEIQSRKIRWRLEERDEEIIKQVRDLYAEWFKRPREGFLQWLYNNDRKVLSSALKRMDDWTTILI